MSFPEKPSPLGVFIRRNWPSLTALTIVGGSLFASMLLLALDFFAPTGNPSIGVLVGFAMIVAGGGLMGWGLWVGPFRLTRKGFAAALPSLVIDPSRAGDRSVLALAAVGGLVLLLVVTLGSFRGYRFTESREFRSETYRTIMKPEFVTGVRSPHAHVACVKCHLGPGAAGYVKARTSGPREAPRAAFNPFHRPALGPIMNLRPARETCEQCHWPEMFVGDRMRTHTHFLGDETNTPFTVRMLLKVGGADPSRGPVEGIHWHMNLANQIEYLATDARNQVIPWVRVTDHRGVVTEFQTPDFKMDSGRRVLHRMDCMDCHNRPAHVFKSPDKAVDLSLALRRIDPTIPGVKREVETVLGRSYPTELKAMQKIAAALHAKYSGDPRLETTVDEVQKIFRDNFFPEMKVDWRAYPDNIGHREWPGCFRCHDGEHKTPDGKRTIKANDCRACHLIVAQGRGAQLDQLNAAGWDFQHPGGVEYGDALCVNCHAAGQ